MPVGTAATVKAMHPNAVQALGADIVLCNTYHLMLAPGRRADRGARRPAQIHELAPSDPHRFRRLSGDEPRQAAQAQRARRDLPVAYRRLAPRAHARAVDGDPAAARLRHPDAARRMRAAALLARGGRARDAPVAAMGGAFEERLRRAAGQGGLRHRPGRHGEGSSRRSAPRRWSRWTSTATRSAALRSASRRR